MLQSSECYRGTAQNLRLREQKQFVREVTLAAKLKHPNIVRIEDWGRDDNGLYVVMDFLEGGSLKRLLDHHGPIPLKELLQYARQICLGLQEAHQQGTIHRDLKPANILLDRTGNALLADFGLARSFSGDREDLVRSTGIPMFSPPYASPEQMNGEPLDVRTDLFSLGATLYHMAKGTPAYDRDFDLDEIPEELRPLLSGLLKKKREQRPATADALLEQLDKLQAHNSASVSPPPSSGSQPVRRTARPVVAVAPAEEDLASLVEKVLAKVTNQHTQARELLSQHLYAEAVAALEEIPNRSDICWMLRCIRNALDCGIG
jgi:serine/threonine protein kinase